MIGAQKAAYDMRKHEADEADHACVVDDEANQKAVAEQVFRQVILGIDAQGDRRIASQEEDVQYTALRHEVKEYRDDDDA